MKKRGGVSRKLIAFLLIVIASAATLYVTGFIRKDCKDDKECFNWALKKCISSRVVLVKNNNIYTYGSVHSFGKMCKVDITLERVAVGADLELKRLLEGKSMTCKVPKDKLQQVDIENFEDLMSYCHGELKEGLYELIIQRAYSLIIANLGDVVKELEGTLKRV
ncbi:hypothetical protein HYT58_02215 [Candidatus Woesearchaeota archaeon]|nr:hypothetical protein [Candidatus Woesearchaeota archaeon]